MKKIFILLIFVSFHAIAGGPKVPSQLRFGGMILKITPGGQRELQKLVDAMHASPTHHEAMANKARLYFPIIERIFAENRVPDAIKFLAIQESGLTSDAVSSANAVGYWQFKDFTAREMGLRVDRKVDERQNIVSASEGAAKYLSQNNFYFKNWIYAVMAYQTGRGGAQKHIDKSYLGANKMTIDENTYWYVMKFLAHYIAYRETTLGTNTDGWQLAEYKEVANKDLDKIARELDVDADKLKSYNTWISGKIPEDKEYTVLVPVQGKMPKGLVAYSRADRDRIEEPTAKKYPDELIPGITESGKSTIIKMNGLSAILAKESDDVSTLSARVGLSEEKFRLYNEMKESEELIPGEFYYSRKKKSKGSIEFHIVQYDETLWDISQQYGVRQSKLAKMNGISIIDDLKPGRVMLLNRKYKKGEEVQFVELEKPKVARVTEEELERGAPIPSYSPSSDQAAKVKIHTVAKGEGLWTIAKKYDVSVADLQKWNDLGNSDAIRVGQNLQVKAPISERESKKVIEYEVVKGDNLYQISRKFGMSVDDILELNDMSLPDLSIGQKIKVYQN